MAIKQLRTGTPILTRTEMFLGVAILPGTRGMIMSGPDNEGVYRVDLDGIGERHLVLTEMVYPQGPVISFAWTTEAVIARMKWMTRRKWPPQYARQFHEGQVCQGWDRSPRVGGRPVVSVYLNCDPQQQRTGTMTEADHAGEGFKWMEEQGLTIGGQHPRQYFDDWKDRDEVLYVVRFQVSAVFEPLDVYRSRVAASAAAWRVRVFLAIAGNSTAARGKGNLNAH